MSSGQEGDWEATKEQIKKPTHSKTRKNWLRHQGVQNVEIDRMILEGNSTIEEIAEKLNQIEDKQRPFHQRIQRVKNHIAHLQEGDTMTFWHGMKPHRLKVKEDAQGKLSFDV